MALVAGLVWFVLRPNVEQTSRPLSFQEARSKCPIPLPAGARNVQFAFIQDWIYYQCFVRFEVNYDEGVAHAENVFRDHAEQMKWKFTEPRREPITSPPSPGISPDRALRVEWFDVAKIRSGISFGELNSWQPQVWVDKDRNLFFYCLTD